MRAIRKFLFWFLLISTVVWLAGQLRVRRIQEGDEESDTFTVAAMMGGKQFRSRATSLRSGRAIVQMGGLDVDLRQATLDPAGARLEVKASLGGVRVLVSENWRVVVTADTKKGELEVDVKDPDDLPEDAPRLTIDMVIRGGGGLVTTTEDRDVTMAPVTVS